MKAVKMERLFGQPERKRKQISSQTVVQSRQSADCFGREAFQESAQGGLIWETLESEHFQESSVVLQDFGLVDSPKPHDNSIDQSQNQFGRVIVGSPLWAPDMPLEQMAKSELVAKTLNQPHPAKVCDVGFVEGKTDFSGTFWHMTQNTFLRRFLSQNLIHLYYTTLSSTIHYFSS